MANTYLSRTPATVGNQKTFTTSVWVKRATGTIANGDFDSSNYIISYVAQSGSPAPRGAIWLSETGILAWGCNPSGSVWEPESNVQVNGTNVLFRDPSAWYHIVFAVDTTQATESNRLKCWVNGVQYSMSAYPAQNLDTGYNYTHIHNIGRYASGGTGYSSFLMSHFHQIDGTAYDASAFGEFDATTGIWKPKTAPSVTYGTNGFFLKFENSGSMGLDSSPNGNDFTVNGTLTQTVDTPTNVFATLNGLNVGGGNSTLSNGNTTYSLSNYSYNTRSTLGMPSGKFYWEQKVNATSDVRIGLCTSGFTTDLDTDSVNAYYGGSGGGGVYVLNSGPSTSWQRTNNDTSRNIDTYSTAIASGSTSILMGAVDVDAGKLWVGVDGVWMNSGNPATGANAQITFTNNSGDELQIFAGYGTSSARVSSFNFGNGYFGTTAISSEGINASGNGKFEYDVPTGFTALSTKGLNL